MNEKGRLILLVGGVSCYLLVMVFSIATAPDLGLRVGITGADGGALITEAEGVVCEEGNAPAAGDVLTHVGEWKVGSAVDFPIVISRLRGVEIPTGGRLAEGVRPYGMDEYGLPRLVEIGDSVRWVEVRFRDAGTGEQHARWLQVQRPPLRGILFTLLIAGLGLAGLIVAGVACWWRLQNPAPWVYLRWLAFTTIACVAGMWWWVVAGSFWMFLPGVIALAFTPAVMIHFFSIPWHGQRGGHAGLARSVSYGLPFATIVAGLVFVVPNLRVHKLGDVEFANSLIRTSQLAIGIWCGLCVIAVIVAALLARRRLIQSHRWEDRRQLMWMTCGSLLSFGVMTATVTLTVWDQGTLGERWRQMALVSAACLFFATFALNVIRFRFLQISRIIPRETLYSLITVTLGTTFCVLTAMGVLVIAFGRLTLASPEAFAVAGGAVLLGYLLLRTRDVLNRLVEQKFVRDRYRLDRAVKRIHQAASELGNRQAVGDMLLSACHDVLGTQAGGLYLGRQLSGTWTLAAATGTLPFPQTIHVESQVAAAINERGNIQRVTTGTRAEMTDEQSLLRELHAGLMHRFTVDEETVGLIVLGEKSPPSPFTAEDLTFLTAIEQIAHFALHSAFVVRENVEQLNTELQRKLETIRNQQKRIGDLQSELMMPAADPRPSLVNDRKPFRRDAFIGRSPVVVEVLDTVRKVAASESSVLIRGESGTGKEVLSRVLHENSPRRDGPLVQVHCASLSPSLLESELFGHVKGSFTGAHKDRQGRFAMAHGGTLFLDEIGDISLDTQVKMLRVLQERSFEPVGGTQTIEVDVRLITATHQDLEQLIRDGKFREDLFYRLNVISLSLPGLRDRVEDIFPLALHFLRRACVRLHKSISKLSPDAIDSLERYQWPGNIRELENVIERAVVLAEGDEITSADLPWEVVNPSNGSFVEPIVQAPNPPSPQLPEPQPVPVQALPQPTPASPPPAATTEAPPPRNDFRLFSSESEREQLLEALRQSGGNKAKAARMLGMPRSTFYSKLKKHEIESPKL